MEAIPSRAFTDKWHLTRYRAWGGSEEYEEWGGNLGSMGHYGNSFFPGDPL